MVNDQKGAALPIVLTLLTVFFVLLAGTIPMFSNESRFARADTRYVTARYAAEAAAKYGIQQVQTLLKNGTAIGAAYNRAAFDCPISTSSNTKVTCKWNLDNNTSPTMILIRTTATCKGVSTSANVNFYLKDSPIYKDAGIVDLINTGNYSHSDHNPLSPDDKRVRWKLDTSTTPISAKPNVTVSQVLFNDVWTDKGMDVTYRASAVVNNANGTTTGGGYGIYYGAIGNGDCMNAYVLQFDPGAQDDKSKKYVNGIYKANYGTLLVKKVVFDPNNTNPDHTDTSNFQITTDTPGNKEVNQWSNYPSGTNGDYYALPFQAPQSGEVMRVPLSSADDGGYNGTSLETLMENYYKSQGKTVNFDPKDPHSFRIEVVEINGKLVHQIYCDDNPTPILKFSDHSSGNAGKYKLTTFKGSHTGARVWDDSVTVTFRNEITSSSSQKVMQSIVWIK